MPYRDSEVSRPETQGEVLASVDASGTPGSTARDGPQGADGTSSGSAGQPGGAAGRATPGGHAGRMEVVLARAGGGLASLRGQRSTELGAEVVDARVEFGEHGFIDLVARGGAGGAGGRGGRGGTGARGSRGQDATRYSSGSNGGCGGTGGDGGLGTHGAPGGQGGLIRVQVADEDTHLLMLLRQGVEGGAGGAVGQHGAGGFGGDGGRGGSSHSWTTTTSYSGPKGEHRTRTDHHSNPGGHSGSAGHPGSPGHGPLLSGSVGPDGEFRIEVSTVAGLERGASRYHFLLAHVEVHTRDRDGITEPGERIELRKIRLRNVGQLASPRHSDVQLVVRASNWVRPIEGALLTVPRGVAAGAEVEVPGVLAFELRDYSTTAASDALGERELIVIEAVVPEVNRTFEPFVPGELDASRTLHVRFPVAASILEALPSLAPDEVSKLRFAITNPSRIALGGLSDSKRVLRVRVALHESELDDRHAVLLDEHGARCSLRAGWVRELPRLDTTTVFEGAVGIRADAPTYRALRLRLTLELGRLDAPDITRVVQYRDVEVRVGARMATSDFDWLLVTHHRTTREEIDAWEALARSMHARIAYFDLSLYGELNVEAPFEGGAPLAERLRGGLMIVLGYPMQTPEGPRAPASFLDANTLAALHRVRADLLIVGGDCGLEGLLASASSKAAEGAVHEGETALLRFLQSTRMEQDGHALDVRAVIHEVVFGMGLEDAKEARLVARAQALTARLTRHFPEREHDVAFEFEPDFTPAWTPLRRRQLGFLRVTARASGRGGAGHVTFSDVALADPTHILSETMRIAVLVSRGFDDRLQVLAKMLAQEAPDRALVTAVVDALLLGIAGEQLAVVRLTRARQGLTRARLEEGLVRLKALTEAPLPVLEMDSEGAQQLIRMLASIRFFVRAQTSLWERIPGLAWSRRASQLRSITEAHLAAWVAMNAASASLADALEQRAKEALAVHESAWQQAKKNGQRKKGVYARMLLLAPAWGAMITTDEELTLEHAGRVESLSVWKSRHAHAQQRGLLAAEVSEGLDDERARLIVMTKTSALP